MHSSTFWLNNFSHFYLKTEQNESSQQQSKISARIRVFKPARWLAQFKTGVPGFDRVARVNSIFFKNQNDVVLVKKKKTGYNWVLSGQPDHQVTLGFDFLYFFLNPIRFQLQVDPPGRTGFQNYGQIIPFSIPCTFLPSPLVLVSS